MPATGHIRESVPMVITHLVVYDYEPGENVYDYEPGGLSLLFYYHYYYYYYYYFIIIIIIIIITADSKTGDCFRSVLEGGTSNVDFRKQLQKPQNSKKIKIDNQSFVNLS